MGEEVFVMAILLKKQTRKLQTCPWFGSTLTIINTFDLKKMLNTSFRKNYVLVD